MSARSTSLRISEEARGRLTAQAAREGVSVTALLERLILEGIDALEHPGIVFRGPPHDRLQHRPPVPTCGRSSRERWERETALDEHKTPQRGPRVVLRSKDPDGVYQETYAHLAVHYAIRTLMHDGCRPTPRVKRKMSNYNAKPPSTRLGRSPPRTPGAFRITK